MIKIALDIMGGDKAPLSNIFGAIDFLKSYKKPIKIYFVGDAKIIKKAINDFPSNLLNKIEILHASENIDDNDKPSRIIKNKPDSSMIKSIDLLKNNRVNAVISSGNTGCLLSSSFFKLGMIDYIKRPTIPAFIPSENGNFLITDVGANVQVKPDHLLQFSKMASVYMKYQLDIDNPKIALLNIGSESNKGTELTKDAYKLLDKELKNFIGNIESRYIFEGKADIILCDGFTGNIVLKLIEGMTNYNFNLISSKLNLENNSMIDKVKKLYDYEQYGASPILGIKGLVFKSHGSSSKIAIKSAISNAVKLCKINLVNKIQEAIN
jgi:glycerol-3-phosphate acyltransferase PlsX